MTSILESYPFTSYALIIGLVSSVYLLGLGVYRLFLHPLAKFPGPKYAALSRWHEAYYDIYLSGKLIFWIEEQHKKYGTLHHPIIRPSPF
jgi:hypothetical protein